MSTIAPRKLDVEFSAVPRFWLGGLPTPTAVANGVNMLFPHGERFFIRSVHHFIEQLDDPALRADVRGFCGQEGRHAHAHDRLNATLRAQGYEVDRFLDGYKRLSSWLEGKLPPKLNLAITAAAEHFTAIMAEGAFTLGMLDTIAPAMRDLLAWHAAEEIEHKAVAFDVLRAVDPSYALRLGGLVLATALLGGFWLWGSTTLLRQDGVGWRRALRELRDMGRRDPIVRRVFARGIREYVRRDFHPDDTDHRRLAADWFAARGLTLPEVA
jgi:predicted metal-dependent hydrolase